MIDPVSKIQAARTAGRVYVDSYQDGDRVAVTGFSGDGDGGCEAETHFPLTDWSEGTRQAANDAIVDITAAAPPSATGSSRRSRRSRRTTGTRPCGRSSS
jgi:hypothetical protein